MQVIHLIQRVLQATKTAFERLGQDIGWIKKLIGFGADGAVVIYGTSWRCHCPAQRQRACNSVPRHVSQVNLITAVLTNKRFR